MSRAVTSVPRARPGRSEANPENLGLARAFDVHELNFLNKVLPPVIGAAHIHTVFGPQLGSWKLKYPRENPNDKLDEIPALAAAYFLFYFILHTIAQGTVARTQKKCCTS